MAATPALQVASPCGHESGGVRPNGHAGVERLANQVFPRLTPCKGEARQADPEETLGRNRLRRHPLGRLDEVDHEAQNRRFRMRGEPADAVAADLDQANDRRMRPGDEAAVMGFQPDAVVADEGGVATLQIGAVEQREAERGFSRARRPPHQDTRLAEEDAARMDGERGGGIAHAARSSPKRSARGATGRRTMKRAPRTVGCPSSSAGPGRFSARIVP